MSAGLPDLSRFELQCLRLLWDHGQASVREIHERLDEPPSYSTIRKIFERLEQKGAIERVGKSGRAVVYRSCVSRPAGTLAPGPRGSRARDPKACERWADTEVRPYQRLGT